jgi:hypothetical protein
MLSRADWGKWCQDYRIKNIPNRQAAEKGKTDFNSFSRYLLTFKLILLGSLVVALK